MIEVIKSKIFKLSATIILPLVALSLSAKTNPNYGMFEGNGILGVALVIFGVGVYITFFKNEQD